MAVEVILIILSSLVIFSYLFDMAARQFKVPSVILLMLSGIGLHYATYYFGVKTINFESILPLLGTVGLILIVLEGALELKLEKEKTGLIKKSMASAFFILILTNIAIGLLFYYLTGQEFRLCMISAAPLSIISSAIAIPSSATLPVEKREFVIYESSLSDIFGIVLFNFLISNDVITPKSFLILGFDTLIVIVLSVFFCLLLLYLLKRINHHLKFFLIISVLIFAYALGKYSHLSSLIIVLGFGLFLNNVQWIQHPAFKRIFTYDKFSEDFTQMIQLTGESAFIIRTFFFMIFGFTLNVELLTNLTMLRNGLFIIVLIYLIRFLYQRLFLKSATTAELFLSPRGLISILLFFSIPDNLKLKGLESGLLFFIILATSVIMTLGLRTTGEKKFSP